MYEVTWIENSTWQTTLTRTKQAALDYARALERRSSCRCVRVDDREGNKVPHRQPDLD